MYLRKVSSSHHQLLEAQLPLLQKQNATGKILNCKWAGQITKKYHKKIRTMHFVRGRVYINSLRCLIYAQSIQGNSNSISYTLMIGPVQILRPAGASRYELRS